jgi:hypothetical protein
MHRFKDVIGELVAAEVDTPQLGPEGPEEMIRGFVFHLTSLSLQDTQVGQVDRA